MNVDIGQRIGGKYELVRLLGKGAMGEVWLATHTSLAETVAIKLLEPAEDFDTDSTSARFQLEAQIAAKLSRKTRHIVSVSDHGEENGIAYLVMERLEGESLDQRLDRGALHLPEVAAIVTQIARALTLAHEEGIVHRDLKPANVWLGRDEDGRLLVKLLDFGIARSKKPFRTRSPVATAKDMVLGTPSYMSPEQARGLDSLDYRCDLWALAVVLYEALAGTIPFEGDTVENIFLSICTFRTVPVRRWRPDLPPPIEAFFAKAFAEQIEHRFSTAAELTEAFVQFVSPEELDEALGLSLIPSASRLRASYATAPMGSMSSEPRMQVSHGLPPRPQNLPNIESMSVPLGPNVVGRRGGPRALLFAITGLLVLLGVVGVVMIVSARGSKTKSSQPIESSTSQPLAKSPPNITEPPAIPIDLPQPPSTSKITEPLPTPSAESPPKRVTAVQVPSSIKPVTTPAATSASAPPAPTPSPAKSVNKGEIF